MGMEQGWSWRSLNFFHDICLEYFKVQLFLAPYIEAETSAFVSLVAVIFGTGGRKLDNDILIIQFVFKLLEVGTGGKLGLAGRVLVNNTVRVHIQHLLGCELTEGLTIQVQASMAGGEACHKNVDVRLDRRCFGYFCCKPPPAFLH